MTPPPQKGLTTSSQWVGWLPEALLLTRIPGAGYIRRRRPEAHTILHEGPLHEPFCTRGRSARGAMA
jgi:hypothetical protein